MSSWDGLKNKISQIQTQTKGRLQAENTPVTTSEPKSTYQTNVAKPVQNSTPTTRSAVAKMYQVTQSDPQLGKQYQKNFVALQSKKDSMYYNPYTKPTNQAAKNLQSYGVDTTQDGWYDSYSWLKNYYNTSDTTNNATKPGKNASAEEKMAYEYAQYTRSMADTEKAKTESAALKEELAYWANRTDRNYSDDEIIRKIDWKKYPTLAKMKDTAATGQPMELNEAIDMATDDWMYATIWASRNDGGTGNLYKDMALSYLGEGNVWQENPEIAAKLDFNNRKDFSPYSVGSTLNQEALYYGVSSFDKDWLDKNRPDMNDETSVKMWNNVQAAEEFTSLAEEQLAEANAWLDKQLANVKTQEDIDRVMKNFDRRLDDRWGNLQKMDASMQKADNLIGTTRAIDYSRNDVLKKVQDACVQNGGKLTATETAKANGVVIPGQSDEVTEAQDAAIRGDASIYDEYGTEAERNQFNNAPSTTTGPLRSWLNVADTKELLAKNEQAVSSAYITGSIPLYESMMKEQDAQAALDSLMPEWEATSKKLAAIESSGLDPELYASLSEFKSSDAYQELLETFYNNDGVLMHPTAARKSATKSEELDRAYMSVYQAVTGDYGASGENVFAKGEEWWNVLQGDVVDLSEEDIRRFEILDAAKTENEQILAANEGAGKQYEDQLLNFQHQIQMYDAAGIDTTELRTAYAMSVILPLFGEKALVTQYAEQTTNPAEDLEDAKFILEYVDEAGITLPEGYRDSINKYISKLEWRLTGKEYTDLQKEDDFVSLAEKGREMEKSLNVSRDAKLEEEDENGYSLGQYMTPEEKDTYYYLMAKYGKNDPMAGYQKAMEYWGYLGDPENGVLNERTVEAYQEDAITAVKNNPILANALAMLAAPVEGLLGATYIASSLAMGWELNPNSALLSVGKFSETVNEETSKAIRESTPDGSLWQNVALGAYEIIYNRGRSMTNAALTGGLSIGGKLGDILTEIVGALPMAIGAASMAIADAKEKNADDGQAYLIGGVTMLMESLTEGLTRSNIQKAFSGGGEDVVRSVGDLVRDWLTRSGLEEAFGETLTDYVENWMDDHFSNVYSDHDQRIDSYLAENNLDRNNPADLAEAEEAVGKEEIAGLVHTAIISFLSPGLDVVTGSVNDAINDFHNIRTITKQQQQAGNPVSMGDVRKAYKEWKNRTIAEAQRLDKKEKETTTTTERTGTVAKPAQQQQAEQATTAQTANKGPSEADKNFLADLGKLDAVQNSDTNSQTAAIGALFGGEEGTPSGDTADAVGAGLKSLFGSNAIKTLRDIALAASRTGQDGGRLKQALQNAALSASSMARQMINSEAFQNATSAAQAMMLGETVEQDANNPTVAQESADYVHENRVANAEEQIIAEAKTNGADPYEKTHQAENDLNKANEDLHNAEESLDEKTEALAAASENVTVTANAMLQDPSDANKKEHEHAVSEMQAAAAVQNEYEQHLSAIQRAVKAAQTYLEGIRNLEKTVLREQAEQRVAQEDQARAEAAAQAEAAIAEQQRIEAEQAAQEQAEEQKASEAEAKEEQTTNTDREQQIRARLQEIGYAQEDVDRLTAKAMNRIDQNTRKNENLNTRISDNDGKKFLRKINRMTGMTYEMQDLGDPYKNRGKILDRNHIILNSNLTKGQALVEAALHEVTHGLEETKAYQNYSSFVLNAMYGGENTQEYQTALKKKMDEYASMFKGMTPEQRQQAAKYELVAEYARLNLGKKEFVRAITAQGLAGKFRELIDKAMSMLRGYSLDAEGRAKYNELRTAAKLLNEAVKERAEKVHESDNGHTGLVQASINGWTDATGLELEVTDDDNYVYKLKYNGQEIKPGEYKPEMVKGTPVGNLIDMAAKSRTEVLTDKLARGRISQQEYDAQLAEISKTSNQQRKYVSDIINMIGKYQDAAMVWELAGSLAFSSLKTNGDPQYSDSYDFGTICTKTQAILNAISETQVRLGRALTKAEIDGVVYEEVGKGVQKDGKWIHGATPCPPCYVYATWVNKPARLEKVRLYQQECANWTDEQINEFMNRPDPVGKTKSKTKELKTEQNTQKLWISLCLADEVTDPETGETSWKRKENPDICPNEILLDLRRSGDMATQHPGTWTFMQKGGNAQGKAIAPYSDARLGESIVAKAIGAGEANARLLEDERNGENPDYIPQFLNPFLSADPGDQAEAEKYFKKAVQKIKAQNLKGGQRWQSWSDFRAEWGSDYLMEMITMQALGSQVQTYTKVVEALDLLASAGFEVNMSLMPYGDGFWHNEDGSIMIDEDGNMKLRFSPVTGINPEAAEGYAKKYGLKGNVQPMVVGISDEHIKAALAGDYITFVIPFHGSGGSVQRLQNLMALLHEQMKTGNDYTKAQSDEFENYITVGEGKSKKKVNTNPNWSLREAILTGQYDSLTDEQKSTIEKNPYLNKLYEDRYINEDSDAFGVFFSKGEAQQIYPYEYWDTKTTLATADENSKRFIKYCQMLGVIPRFSGLTKTEGKGKNKHDVEYANFSGRSVDKSGNVTYNPVKGYWKLLIDRSMYNRVYDENGKIQPEKCTYHKPQAVSTADINVGMMPQAANNTVGHSDDDTREITERIIQRLEMTSGQNAAAGSAVNLEQNKKTLEKVMYGEAATEQASSLGDLSDTELDELVRETDQKYYEAVQSGDMVSAQQIVDETAEKAGYTETAYHGTDYTHGFGFTKFDMDESQGAIFVAYDEVIAGTYTNTLAKVRNISDSGKTIYDLSDEDFDEFALGSRHYLTDENGEGYYAKVMIGNDGYVLRIEPKRFGDNWTSKTVTEKELRDLLSERYDQKSKEGIYRLYTRPGNQLVIDAEDHNWDEIPFDLYGSQISSDPYGDETVEYTDTDWDEDFDPDLVSYGATTREIAKWAKAHGYDSVKIYNVFDDGGRSHTRNDGMDGYGDIGIFFNQEDVKSADAVTYDDQGNVIPPSERFNTSENDIRHSMLGDLSDEEIDSLLHDLGMLEQEDVPYTNFRQFGVRTAQNNPVLSPEVNEFLKKYSGYVPYSNKEQMANAYQWVADQATEGDPEGYSHAMSEVLSNTFDYASADGQARTLAVLSMAIERQDTIAQARLADAYNSEGTDIARALQARKIFKLMTPEGRIATMENMARRVNEEIEKRTGKKGTVQIPKETLNEIAEADTDEKIAKVRKKVASQLAQQIPANWKDRLRGWRMLSMLGNPRTHIRNILGNALFVPVVSLKNKLGAVGEIVSGQQNRTKTLAPVLPPAIRNFSKQDAIAMKDTLTGEAKYNEDSMVERARKPFSGLLQALIDFNSDRLEKEDWHFLRNHYQRALGGWMQANGYTAEQLQNNPQLLEQGRAYAVQEAQKATYRDFSKLAQTLNRVSRDGGVAGFIVDAVLPFKKTPANILKRGLEYSPAGIMRSLTTDLYHLKQWTDYKNGKLDALPEKAISPTQFIDRICSGLAGSAILAAGFLLSNAGIVSCGLDDDDDELEKAKGNQEYAFKFSIGGKDYTYTVDWAAPMSMPFFVGAAIQEQLSKEGDFDIEQVINAFGNITEPVFNLSMLDGINSLFKTSQYDDTNTLTQIGAKVASNYATSYVPSLLGAVARTIDDTRRKAFVESGKGTGIAGTFRYAVEQTENKIPGLSQTNIPYRDVWGNAETSSLAERIVENFISPGYIEEYGNDPILDEMARLYDIVEDQTLRNSLVPSDPAKSFTYNKKKYVLSAEQWDTYKKERGQAAYNGLTELLANEDYQNANAEVQAQMISDVWSYADKVGKSAIVDGYLMENKGADPIASIAGDAKVSGYKSEMIKALEAGDLIAYETMVEALRDEDVEDSAIKSAIAAKYRDQYKDAYINGQPERMAEIEDILFETGFDFDTGAWEDQADEKYGR